MSRSTLSITDWCSGFSSPYSSRQAAKIFPELARWKTTNCKTNLFSCINPFIAQKCLIARVEPRLWSHFWLLKDNFSCQLVASPQTSFGVRSSRIHFSPTEKWMRDKRTPKDVRGEASQLVQDLPNDAWICVIYSNSPTLPGKFEWRSCCTTHVPSLWSIVKALSLFVLSYVATKLRSSREEWEVRAIKLHFLTPEWKLV